MYVSMYTSGIWYKWYLVSMAGGIPPNGEFSGHPGGAIANTRGVNSWMVAAITTESSRYTSGVIAGPVRHAKQIFSM